MVGPPVGYSIHELRQHMGKHTTFHDCNVFTGLANALPRATVEDTQPSPMGNSLEDDLTASSSTSEPEVPEVEDTQPSPTGTPLADDPTVPSAIPKTEVRENLSATWSTSPVKLGEDLVTLTAVLADQLTDPPTLASSMGNEGIPKMDKGAFLLPGSCCGKHPLQSQRILVVLQLQL